MAELALAVSIAAIAITFFGVILQWLAYRAATEQLGAATRENARLGEDLSRWLGQIHEVATGTRSSLDATVSQLVSGLLGRVGPPAEGSLVAGAKGRGELEEWRVNQGVSLLAKSVPGQTFLDLLRGPSGFRGSADQIVALMPKGEEQLGWALQLMIAVGVLVALGLVAVDGEAKTVSLTAEGTEVARRLSERACEPGSSAGGKAAP